ncbi:MAG: 6,7-dimethyl-8-ribityllumazine synthase [Verrucomicrobia bacterium]|nr:MAG: 6,7-dimethyl-8-ribityllumazine synthase [Verrucomicrobiota bacterium]
MLKPVKRTSTRRGGGTFAIVASQYNRRYVDSMLRAAGRSLRAAGAEKVVVVRVPGAYEIPIVAARLARAHPTPFSAILCLGVILRGQTSHAQHIGEVVSHALAQIQIRHEVPVIHEVLLLENEQQAKARCLSRQHNRGTEAAQTALAMARIMKRLT